MAIHTPVPTRPKAAGDAAAREPLDPPHSVRVARMPAVWRITTQPSRMEQRVPGKPPTPLAGARLGGAHAAALEAIADAYRGSGEVAIARKDGRAGLLYRIERLTREMAEVVPHLPNPERWPGKAQVIMELDVLAEQLRGLFGGAEVAIHIGSSVSDDMIELWVFVPASAMTPAQHQHLAGALDLCDMTEPRGLAH